jgi:hypothetical protein
VSSKRACQRSPGQGSATAWNVSSTASTHDRI